MGFGDYESGVSGGYYDSVFCRQNLAAVGLVELYLF